MGVNWSVIDDPYEQAICERNYNTAMISLVVNVLLTIPITFVYWFTLGNINDATPTWVQVGFVGAGLVFVCVLA